MLFCFPLLSFFFLEKKFTEIGKGEVGKRDTPSTGNNIHINKIDKKETDAEHTLVTDDSGSYATGASEVVNDDST